MPGLKLQNEWKLATSSQLEEVVEALAWAPGEHRLAALTAAGELLIEPIDDIATAAVRQAHPLGGLRMAWHPDGKLLATGGQDGTVSLWEPEADTPICTLPTGGGWISDLCWWPDGKTLGAAVGKRFFRWHADGTAAAEPAIRPTSLATLAIRPQHAHLTTLENGAVCLWDTCGAEPLLHLPYEGPLLALAWHPGGRILVCSSQDSSVHVWLLKGRKAEEFQMSGFPRKIAALAWSPKGKFLATPSGPGIPVWKIAHGKIGGLKPMVHDGHASNVEALAAQHDDKLWATGDRDGVIQVRLWGQKAPVATLKADAGILALAWSSDSRCLAAATRNANLHIWTR